MLLSAITDDNGIGLKREEMILNPDRSTDPQVRTAIGATTNLPRLAHLSFINSLPITVPIASRAVEIEATLTTGTPAELNRAFATNSVDLGSLSSAAYLDLEDLQLLDQLAISGNGAVGSVLFFSKIEPEKLGQARVVVPLASRTSVNLLVILLAEIFGIRLNPLADHEPDLAETDVDACLVIGDQALLVDEDWSTRAWRWDLGLAWKEMTGLPMVFAVWAARRSWARANAEDLARITLALVRARDLGLGSLLPAVVEEAHRRTGLSEITLQRYYRQYLDYSWSDRHSKGLDRFEQLLQKHNLLVSFHSESD